MDSQTIHLAPIAIFVFRRPQHTEQVLRALSENAHAKDSSVFIFSDGPRTESDIPLIEEVRSVCKQSWGFKTVELILSEKNQGLANSIIRGVTQIVNQFGDVIVLEDDLVASPFFLQYMNQALDLYKNESSVASIHAYVEPVQNTLPETFFLRGADCWGWATWKRAWDQFNPDGASLLNEIHRKRLSFQFDMDGSYKFESMLRDQIAGINDSWAIRWHASAFLKNMLTLYPRRSLVTNIGLDGSGTHCISTPATENEFRQAIEIKPIDLQENRIARKAIVVFNIRKYKYYQRQKMNLKRFLHFLFQLAK